LIAVVIDREEAGQFIARDIKEKIKSGQNRRWNW